MDVMARVCVGWMVVVRCSLFVMKCWVGWAALLLCNVCPEYPAQYVTVDSIVESPSHLLIASLEIPDPLHKKKTMLPFPASRHPRSVN